MNLTLQVGSVVQQLQIRAGFRLLTPRNAPTSGLISEQEDKETPIEWTQLQSTYAAQRGHV